MEQDPSLNDVIIDWLADYTHFICDQFNFPHDEAKGLLQRYLDLTAKDSPQQTVTLPLNQPTIYPEIPSPRHETPFRKQGLNAHLSTQPSNLPLGDSVPSKSHRETRLWEDAGFLGSTVPDTTPQGQLTAYGQQPGNVVTTASDLSEASAPYPQQNQRSNQTPIGTVADYDPLWVQKNNVIPLRVHEFRSAMKLETLITAGVVKMGDVLTFQVSVPENGQVLETEAHLAVSGSLLNLDSHDTDLFRS